LHFLFFYKFFDASREEYPQIAQIAQIKTSTKTTDIFFLFLSVAICGHLVRQESWTDLAE